MYRIIKDNSVHKNRSSTAWKIDWQQMVISLD